MAMTLADLCHCHRIPRSSDVSIGLALFLVVLSVVCGLFTFVLCLAAEGSRTEATRYILSNWGHGSDASECIYDASGLRPLAFAVGAFLLLVVAMFAELAYMLVVITSPQPPTLVIPSPAPSTVMLTSTSRIRTLAGQARFLFLATWISFAIAEVLLMFGMAVESSHICQWTKPRSSCHVVRPGLFAAAGVLGFLTVLLGIALYRTQTWHQYAHRRPTPSAPPAQ
ncbi:uncharacterized protein LOC103720022 [Phoenix dactylifera]|uniref:Uncharacterized protein LOC103720022 n=1 Tax=Phoenix dactylifera TaxID=42345 RepID=A0A8B7CW12_PHODC|nr:uncharacterized protein LOC103720022 [Phoenix dactylifera]